MRYIFLVAQISNNSDPYSEEVITDNLFAFSKEEEAHTFLSSFKEIMKKKCEANRLYSKLLVRYDRIYREINREPRRDDIPGYRQNPKYSEDVYQANLHVFNRDLKKFIESNSLYDIEKHLRSEGFSEQEVEEFRNTKFIKSDNPEGLTIIPVTVPENTNLFHLLDGQKLFE